MARLTIRRPRVYYDNQWIIPTWVIAYPDGSHERVLTWNVALTRANAFYGRVLDWTLDTD